MQETVDPVHQKHEEDDRDRHRNGQESDSGDARLCGDEVAEFGEHGRANRGDCRRGGESHDRRSGPDTMTT